MIRFEDICSAVLSSDPYNRMDQIIRAELNSGRTVASVLDDLRPWVDETIELEGLTEDGEEAFLGSLDALSGNCHTSQRYHDSPSPTSATNSGPVQIPLAPEVPDRSSPK